LAGREFVQAFTNREGLKSADKQTFLENHGRKAEPSQSFGVDGFEQLLREHEAAGRFDGPACDANLLEFMSV
jgi:hypothetical protein